MRSQDPSRPMGRPSFPWISASCGTLAPAARPKPVSRPSATFSSFGRTSHPRVLAVSPFGHRPGRRRSEAGSRAASAGHASGPAPGPGCGPGLLTPDTSVLCRLYAMPSSTPPKPSDYCRACPPVLDGACWSWDGGPSSRHEHRFAQERAASVGMPSSPSSSFPRRTAQGSTSRAASSGPVAFSGPGPTLHVLNGPTVERSNIRTFHAHARAHDPLSTSTGSPGGAASQRRFTRAVRVRRAQQRRLGRGEGRGRRGLRLRRTGGAIPVAQTGCSTETMVEGRRGASGSSVRHCPVCAGGGGFQRSSPAAMPTASLPVVLLPRPKGLLDRDDLLWGATAVRRRQ